MMKIPYIPADQDNRVNPLKALDIHDTLPEEKTTLKLIIKKYLFSNGDTLMYENKEKRKNKSASCSTLHIVKNEKKQKNKKTLHFQC